MMTMMQRNDTSHHDAFSSIGYPATSSPYQQDGASAASPATPTRRFGGLFLGMGSSSSDAQASTPSYQPPVVPTISSDFGAATPSPQPQYGASTSYASPHPYTPQQQQQQQQQQQYHVNSQTDHHMNGLFSGLNAPSPQTPWNSNSSTGYNNNNNNNSHYTTTSHQSAQVSPAYDPFSHLPGTTTATTTHATMNPATSSFNPYMYHGNSDEAEEKKDAMDHHHHHGMLEETDNNNDDDDDGEEDKEFARAQEAALYAQELLQKQAAERKRKEQSGPLGLGVLPKAQGLLQQTTTQIKLPQLTVPSFGGGTSNNNNNNNTQKSTVNHDSSFAEDSTRASELPPWYSADQTSQHTSDFGLGGSSSASSRGDNNNHTTAGSAPGKGASVMGASVLGGVAGLVVLGPLAGVVAAGGMAYASAKDGTIGNVMRGAGGLVVKAGSAAKKFDEQNQVVAKTASGVSKGIGWIAKKATSTSTSSSSP